MRIWISLGAIMEPTTSSKSLSPAWTLFRLEIYVAQLPMGWFHMAISQIDTTNSTCQKLNSPPFTLPLAPAFSLSLSWWKAPPYTAWEPTSPSPSTSLHSIIESYHCLLYVLQMWPPAPSPGQPQCRPRYLSPAHQSLCPLSCISNLVLPHLEPFSDPHCSMDERHTFFHGYLILHDLNAPTV